MATPLFAVKHMRCALVPAAFGGRRKLHISSVELRGRTVFFNKHKPVTDPKRQDPEHFEKLATELPLDGNYVDGLQMLYTEKIGSEREVTMKGDDRLIGRPPSDWLPQVDLKAPRLGYAHCDALATAPEPVKRIFSIEFGTRRDLTDAWKRSLIGQVKRHELDAKSLEVRIAFLTAMIRHLSLLVDEINNFPKKPVHFTHKIWLMVNHRRKLLRQLRETDSAAFDKVLEQLKIAYHVPKLPEQMIEKRRKAWGEAQLKIRVEREKEARLTALHERYLTERDTFQEEMNERLASLTQEEEEIRKKLHSIGKLEGRESLRETQQLEDEYWETHKFRPSMMDSLAERILHAALFYFPKPLSSKSV